MNDTVPAAYEKPKSAARSALFGDEPESVPGPGGVTKPVILQHRVSSIATVTVQPRMIECIANSVLGPPANVSRGLGGVSVLGGNMSSSYLDTSSIIIQEQANMSAAAARPRTSKLASYSLQGGYDKWVSLPGGARRPSDQLTVFVPQHLDTELDLAHSFLGRAGRGARTVVADAGLVAGKSSRAGWGRGWSLVGVAEGGAGAGRCLGSVTFSSLGNTTAGELDPAQADSLRQWFQVARDTSVRLERGEGGAMFVPVNSIETLHSHQAEAARQQDDLTQASLQWSQWVKMFSQIWR